MSSLPSDAPSPRLCIISKWPEFDGYGFNLHAEKSKPGQYIGKVDRNSPAETAGLKEEDRIVEVNGVNIANENHKQVVQRIKAVPNETRLLVLDPAADKYYKSKNIVVRGNQENVLVRSSVREKTTTTTEPTPPQTESASNGRQDETDNRSVSSHASSSASETSTQPQHTTTTTTTTTASEDTEESSSKVVEGKVTPETETEQEDQMDDKGNNSCGGITVTINSDLSTGEEENVSKVVITGDEEGEEESNSKNETPEVVGDNEDQDKDVDIPKTDVENVNRTEELNSKEDDVESEDVEAIEDEKSEDTASKNQDQDEDSENQDTSSTNTEENRDTEPLPAEPKEEEEEEEGESDLEAEYDNVDIDGLRPQFESQANTDSSHPTSDLPSENTTQSPMSTSPTPPPSLEPETINNNATTTTTTTTTASPPQPTTATNGNSQPVSNKNSYNSGGLNLNMSAAEMRAMLARKKKADPRKETVDLKTKYQIIQNM